MDSCNKIRFALQAAGEQINVFAEKFIQAETFCYMDVYWWYDSDVHWSVNIGAVHDLIKLLIKEKCLERVGRDMYKKTKKFRCILERIVSVEEILTNRFGGNNNE